MAADLYISSRGGSPAVYSRQLGCPVYYGDDAADCRAWLKSEGRAWGL